MQQKGPEQPKAGPPGPWGWTAASGSDSPPPRLPTRAAGKTLPCQLQALPAAPLQPGGLLGQCGARGGVSEKPRVPGGGKLTHEDEEADQQGDEGARAERRGHHEGGGVARLDGAGVVTAANADSEGAGAAEGGGATVHHQDGQQKQVLFLAVEAQVLSVQPSRVIWGESKTRGGVPARGTTPAAPPKAGAAHSGPATQPPLPVHPSAEGPELAR